LFEKEGILWLLGKFLILRLNIYYKDEGLKERRLIFMRFEYKKIEEEENSLVDENCRKTADNIIFIGIRLPEGDEKEPRIFFKSRGWTDKTGLIKLNSSDIDSIGKFFKCKLYNTNSYKEIFDMIEKDSHKKELLGMINTIINTDNDQLAKSLLTFFYNIVILKGKKRSIVKNPGGSFGFLVFAYGDSKKYVNRYDIYMKKAFLISSSLSKCLGTFSKTTHLALVEYNNSVFKNIKASSPEYETNTSAYDQEKWKDRALKYFNNFNMTDEEIKAYRLKEELSE
jgi:hypothetical protein